MDMHFEGVVFQTHAAELSRRLTRPFPPCLLIDVRPAVDYAEGHVPGARTVTIEEIRRGLPEGVTRNTEAIVLGDGPDDRMVREATKALRTAGYRRIVEFSGGMNEWTATGGRIESGAKRTA